MVISRLLIGLTCMWLPFAASSDQVSVGVIYTLPPDSGDTVHARKQSIPALKYLKTALKEALRQPELGLDRVDVTEFWDGLVPENPLEQNDTIGRWVHIEFLDASTATCEYFVPGADGDTETDTVAADTDTADTDAVIPADAAVVAVADEVAVAGVEEPAWTECEEYTTELPDPIRFAETKPFALNIARSVLGVEAESEPVAATRAKVQTACFSVMRIDADRVRTLWEDAAKGLPRSLVSQMQQPMAEKGFLMIEGECPLATTEDYQLSGEIREKPHDPNFIEAVVYVELPSRITVEFTSESGNPYRFESTEHDEVKRRLPDFLLSNWDRVVNDERP